MIKWSNTERGFRRGEFIDRYGESCSIQESNLPTKNCIWLGFDDANRMHLTQEDAAELAKVLIYFAGTGKLPVE